MSDAWIIDPLVGVGPVRLGMSEDDIEGLSSVLGARYAMDRSVLASGRVIFKESRDLEAPVLTFENGVVTEILVDHHSRFDIVFGAVSAFSSPSWELLTALERAEGAALWGLGGVVFPKLSISTSNFLVDLLANDEKVYWEGTLDQPPRSISVSGPNAFDRFMERYEQVSFL